LIFEKKGIEIEVISLLKEGFLLSIFIFAFLGLILIEELVVIGLKRYINGAFKIENYFLRLYQTYRIKVDRKKVS
jgi:hypothetical protein